MKGVPAPYRPQERHMQAMLKAFTVGAVMSTIFLMHKRAAFLAHERPTLRLTPEAPIFGLHCQETHFSCVLLSTCVLKSALVFDRDYKGVMKH